MCLVGEHDGIHLTGFLLSCVKPRQHVGRVHFRTLQTRAFADGGFQREEIGQLPLKPSDIPFFCAQGKAPSSLLAGSPPASKQAAFPHTFPCSLKRAVTFWTCGHGVLADGEKVPRVSQGWQWGRPTEQRECAGLLNVMSVDGAGKPVQRPTINLSQMH